MEEERRVILIGCGKTKSRYALVAEELYTGPLFKARRQHALDRKLRWAILSAAHGLVPPQRVLHPYDLKLKRGDIGSWACRLRPQLERWLAELEGKDGIPAGTPVVLEVHAGADYLDGVRRARVADVEAPLEGLVLGKQLAWYKDRRSPFLAYV